MRDDLFAAVHADDVARDPGRPLVGQGGDGPRHVLDGGAAAGVAPAGDRQLLQGGHRALRSCCSNDSACQLVMPPRPTSARACSISPMWRSACW